MKNSRLLSILGLMIFSCSLLMAVELSEDDAVQIALEKNLSLKQEGIDLGISARESRSVWNHFLPDITTGINYSQSDFYTDFLDRYGEAYSISSSSVGLDSSNLTAFAAFELDLSASTAANIKSTRIEYESGLISYEMAVKALERDVRIQYNTLLIISETVEIYKKILDTAKKNYERAKLNYELGNARRVDMLSYQVNYESMKPQLIDIENVYETNLLELKRIIGLSPLEELLLSGGIERVVKPISNEDELIAGGLESNMDLQYLRSQMKLLNSRKQELALGTRTPSFKMSYNYTPTINGPSSADLGNDWDDSSSQLDLTLAIPLNGFIPGSDYNLSVKEIEDEVKKMGYLYEDSSRQIGQAIQELILNINKSVKTIGVLRLNIELAQENYNIIDKSYSEGAADYLAVQSAQDELNLAYISEKEEVVTYLSSLFYLEYMVNNSEMMK